MLNNKFLHLSSGNICQFWNLSDVRRAQLPGQPVRPPHLNCPFPESKSCRRPSILFCVRDFTSYLMHFKLAAVSFILEFCISRRSHLTAIFKNVGIFWYSISSLPNQQNYSWNRYLALMCYHFLEIENCNIKGDVTSLYFWGCVNARVRIR